MHRCLWTTAYIHLVTALAFLCGVPVGLSHCITMLRGLVPHQMCRSESSFEVLRVYLFPVRLARSVVGVRWQVWSYLMEDWLSVVGVYVLGINAEDDEDPGSV